MTLHAAATADLLAYAPTDPGQVRLRADFLEVLEAKPDVVWRRCEPDHLTASAVVLDLDRERLVLALHRKVGLWLQVGGHCETGDDSLAAAALREAREESGIAELQLVPGICDLDRHPAPCNPGVVEHHLDVRFALIAPRGAETAVSAESLDVQWFPWSQMPPSAAEELTRLVKAAVRHARLWPIDARSL